VFVVYPICRVQKGSLSNQMNCKCF